MGNRLATLRWSFVLLPVVAFFGFAFQPAVGQGTGTLTGTLEVAWGDPVSAGDTVRFNIALRTDDGRRVALRVPRAVLDVANGPLTLGGRRVEVTLDGIAARGDGSEAVSARSIQTLDPDAWSRAMGTGGATEARPFVTLLCAFPDFPAIRPFTASQLKSRMDTYPGPAHYWLEVSDSQVDVTGPVRGWYVLPKTRTEYSGGGSEPNIYSIAEDCAAAAQDVRFLDHAGINFVFNTDIGCCAYGGTTAILLDGAYVSFPVTWLPGDVGTRLGVIAHEVGHALGLPHSSGPYGVTYDSPWDVMSAAGWYQPPGTEYTTSSHTTIYHKRMLGWIPLDRWLDVPAGTDTILLAPTGKPSAPGYLGARLTTPAFTPWEYYTLEARGAIGYDTPLPGHGVVVHRVGGGGVSPSNVVDLDGNSETHDRGSVLEVGERFIDRVNDVSIHVLARDGDSYRVEVHQGPFATLAVDTTTRTYGSVVGEGVRFVDSARVQVTGPGGGVWQSRISFGTFIELLSTDGRDGDWVRWVVDTRGLPAGPGIAGTVQVAYEGLTKDVPIRIRMEPVQGLAAAFHVGTVADTGVVGIEVIRGVGLSLTGPGADTAAWTVAAAAPWISLDATAGRGSGPIRWRYATDMPAGTYADSIRIEVPGAVGSPFDVRIRRLVHDRPTLTVTQPSARATLPQGGMPRTDSLRLDISGPLGVDGLWNLLAHWSGHIQASDWNRRGSGWARFVRNPGERAPGTYMTAIHLTPTLARNDTVTVYDTLVITPSPVMLTTHPGHAGVQLQGATEMSLDSFYIHPQGPGAKLLPWRIELPPRIHLHSYNSFGNHLEGVGPRWFRYIRRLDTVTSGLHVDTIRVVFRDRADGTAIFVDSLDFQGGSQGELPTLAVLPTTRVTWARTGSAAPSVDSATVTLSGTGSATAPWTAESSSPWITLLSVSGSGSERVRWVRSLGDLAVGTHAASIRISAAATGSPAVIHDTVHIVSGLAVVSTPVRPAGLMGAMYGDSLEAVGAPATVQWSVVAGALPPGLNLDASSGTISGIPESVGSWQWTVAVESGAETANAALRMVVAAPTLGVDAVIDGLLGTGGLEVDHLRYLDLQGNRNGRLDVGDVLAWLGAAGLSSEERDVALRRIAEIGR